MFAKLLTFCSSLFYIGCFMLLATDGQIYKTPPAVIYPLVGSKVVLSWCISPKVSSLPPTVTFYLQNPHGPDITKRAIATVASSGKRTILPSSSTITHLFSPNQLQVIVSNCTVDGQSELQLNYTLVITNLTVTQSRIYKSQANYGVKIFDESETRLIIIDPPTFKVSKSDDEKVIKEGDPLTEVCSTVGELPMTVQWFKDDVLVKEGINSSTLIINNTNRTDSGTYTCVATHKLVTIQRWLNVSVHYPALIKSFGSSKEKSYVGQSVTLSCSFEGNPKPTIRWLTRKPRRTYIPSFKDGVSVLRVVFNSSIDFRNYTCLVNNSIGSDNRTIRITQLFSPGKIYFWKNHTTAHAVTLWWNKTRDNGGSPVTKYEITVYTGSKNTDTKETNDTRIDINNLEKNTSYTFCIRARNVVGFGDENCINITTLYVGPPERPEIDDVELNKNTIRVTWTKVGGEDVTYILRYREKGADEWDKTLSGLSALTYNIKDLKYGITYEIEISAKNSYGESPPSPLREIKIPEQAHTKPPTTASVPSTVPVDNTPRANEQSNGNKTTVIIISVLAVLLVIVAVLFFVLWFKRRSVRDEHAPPGEVDHRAGPVNGDDYAVVKSTKKNPKKNNDLVYAELSEIAPIRDEVKHPSYEPTDYADIAHVLTPNADLVYSNVQPPCAEEGAYANVEEMEKNV